jgi:hypothetical protein
MSQTLPRPADVNVIGRPTPRGRTELETTAQFLLFEPGLYSIDFTVARSVRSEMGLRLPCIRMEPLPAAHYPGRAFVSFAADGGWLSGSEDPAFVLVVGGQAGVILTVYKLAGGMASPEIRIRSLSIQGPGVPPRTTPQASAAPEAPAAEQGPASLPMTVLAHVRAVGDVTSAAGQWAGRPTSNNPVEGFAVTPAGGMTKEDIEYQAVLGHNWNTPWFRGGEYCGSRGLALPLLGFRARLTGQAAEGFELRYWGSFVGGTTIGPVDDGEVCASGEAPLEAVRFAITPRQPGPDAPEPPPAAAPGPPAPVVAARPRRKA